MKFSASISPKKKVLEQKLEEVREAANTAVFQGVVEMTLALHAEAVKGVMKQSAGERQTRYNPKREVVASKPGQPPNIDFGVFVKSIQFEVDATNRVGYVGTNDKRGPWFEFGTKDMAPRPWLAPALAKAAPKLRKILQDLGIKMPKKKG